MNTQHTPGPWTARNIERNHWSIEAVSPHINGYWQTVCELNGPWNSKNYKANANLISAAPDLFEALNDCITSEGAACFGQMNNHPEWMQQRLYAINNIARAAIAKATGKKNTLKLKKWKKWKNH